MWTLKIARDVSENNAHNNAHAHVNIAKTTRLVKSIIDVNATGSANDKPPVPPTLSRRSSNTEEQESSFSTNYERHWSASCPVTAEELQSLADLSAYAAARCLDIERSLLLRFVLANKSNTAKAMERLDSLVHKRQVWDWASISDEQSRECLDREAGYWNVGGRDAEGNPTAFLLQRNAVPAATLDEARCGVKAAHTFFLGVSSSVETLRSGITLVVDMSGVGPSMPAKARNPHARKLGDAYTGVMPLRVRHVLVLDCSLLLRGFLLGSARAMLPNSKVAKVRFVNADELARLVPRSSWPRALRPQITADGEAQTGATAGPPAPPACTSNWEWCSAAHAKLAEQVAELALPAATPDAAAAAECDAKLTSERVDMETTSQCVVS
tara:strand:+ start:1706 stop:2854 length:1149 start_codon:yes stop_codon:yes gene_type:complete